MGRQTSPQTLLKTDQAVTQPSLLLRWVRPSRPTSSGPPHRRTSSTGPTVPGAGSDSSRLSAFVTSSSPDLVELARLLHRRNEVDARIAALIGRPALPGHLGEWIASKVFGIELEASAVAKAIDGHFTTGLLAGSTVNIKFYGKREGMLDTTEDEALDYYLVLSGPRSTTGTSTLGTRPFCIAAVYLFSATALKADRAARGIKGGTAFSVRTALWDAAEVYPNAANPLLQVTEEQASMLRLFSL